MKRRLRIHIVDDDPDAVAMVEQLVREAGHELSVSQESRTALRDIANEQPDCVVLDIMMPGIDGLDLCRQLRQMEALSSVKIIMVTAKAFTFDQTRAMELGADGYILKPIRAASFMGELELILADELQLSFWGVHGTLPVPGKRTVRYGGNTPCVSLSFPNGRLFIFDAGTGIKELSNALTQNEDRIKAKIFITHPHWDHINGLPFFAPLYAQGNEFEILGPSHGATSMHELLSAQMDSAYFPVTIREFAARVYFKELSEGSYPIEGVDVHTLLLSHPGTCLGYRVEYGGRSFCYITDNELFLPDSPYYSEHYVTRLAAFTQRCDVLVMDASYSDEVYPAKVGRGHSCVTQVANLAHEASARGLYLFHHDPDQGDDDIDQKLVVAKKRLKELGSTTQVTAPAEGDMIRF